ncbi:inward rectifier potassium channel 2-like [Liolophura sinensis]|uniref:inward rectifier potassium channel 2-like n=1 Tax=Liolophura sinensis TaxID=3198878 RepID=UPI003158D318
MWNPQGFFPPLPKLKRLVQRNGRTNLAFQAITGKKEKFLKDTFTTLIESQWRWNLILFIGGFVISWHLFAAYYYSVEWAMSRNSNSSRSQPCITNVNTFISTLLFSIETQTTIGYGSRYVTESCPLVFLVVMLQSLFGIGSQVALAGIIVAKVKRGKKSASTVIFSNNACIYEEDGELLLAVRLADIRRSLTLLQAHARGQFIKKQYSASGHLPVKSYNLKMTGEDGQAFLFTAWPTVIVHRINQQSPLWKMSRDDFLQLNFELLVILEGVVTNTGNPFRACVSFLPWDISWGHRFIPLDFIEHEDCTNVDFANFHKTRAVKTPWCSAHDSQVHRVYQIRRVRGVTSVPASFLVSREAEIKHDAADTYLGSLTVIKGRDWL